jgi:hypothetical protein
MSSGYHTPSRRWLNECITHTNRTASAPPRCNGIILPEICCPPISQILMITCTPPGSESCFENQSSPIVWLYLQASRPHVHPHIHTPTRREDHNLRRHLWLSTGRGPPHQTDSREATGRAHLRMSHGFQTTKSLDTYSFSKSSWTYLRHTQRGRETNTMSSVDKYGKQRISMSATTVLHP